MQGYILLLLRSDASLLGLKYLTILIYTFLNPPIRHRYEEKDHAGEIIGAPHSAAARIYTGRFISIGVHLAPRHLSFHCRASLHHCVKI